MALSLVLGEADLIAASYTLKTERMGAVDFLVPVGEETEAVIIKNQRVRRRKKNKVANYG